MTTSIGTSTHTTRLNKNQARKQAAKKRLEEEAAWRQKNGPVTTRQMTPEERIKYGVKPRYTKTTTSTEATCSEPPPWT